MSFSLPRKPLKRTPIRSRKYRMERGAFDRTTGGNYGGLKRDPAKALGTARPEPGSRRAIKAELDRVTSLLVRARDGRCVTCGTTEGLQCSHYFKRSFLATRWSLTNCNAQCAKHNELHNRVPWPYREYMVKLIDEDGLDELFKLRNSKWRPSDDELKALLAGYQQQLRKAA